MPILFVGQEIDAYDCVSPNWDTVASRRRPYHAGAFRVSAASEELTCGKPFGPQTNVWLHFGMRPNGGGTGSTVFNPFAFFNNAGLEVIRISRSATAPNLSVSCWDGSALVPVGLFEDTLPNEANIDVDFHIDCINNKMRAFVDGAIFFDQTIPAAVTDIASFKLSRYNNNNITPPAVSWQETVVSTESTIGLMVAVKRPAGNGTYGDFQGDYTNVNASLLGSGILSETDGDVSTFTKTEFTFAPSGYEAKAVVVSAKASRTPSPESEAALVLRHGGNNYESPYQALDAASKTIQHVWDTDPANSARWNLDLTIGTDMQFGIKSKIPA